MRNGLIDRDFIGFEKCATNDFSREGGKNGMRSRRAEWVKQIPPCQSKEKSNFVRTLCTFAAIGGDGKPAQAR